MNAAAALVVAGAARDYRDGARMAAESIDGGKAQRALVTLMDVSRGIGG